MKGKAVSVHLLPATVTMIGFATQTVARAFMAFERAAAVGSMTALMAPHSHFGHELGEFRVLGSLADGYEPLKHCASLQTVIRPMRDDEE